MSTSPIVSCMRLSEPAGTALDTRSGKQFFRDPLGERQRVREQHTALVTQVALESPADVLDRLGAHAAERDEAPRLQRVQQRVDRVHSELLEELPGAGRAHSGDLMSSTRPAGYAALAASSSGKVPWCSISAMLAASFLPTPGTSVRRPASAITESCSGHARIEFAALR
jgi:hypothetical protein